jgi:hypothetical protein
MNSQDSKDFILTINEECLQQRYGKSKTGGETPLRANLNEKTSLVLSFSPIYYFHP